MAVEERPIDDAARLPESGRLAGDGATGDVLLDRLEHLISFYDRYNTRARRAYRWLKLLQILLAALVPIFVGLDVPKLPTGALGGAIVVIEGAIQLWQFQERWIRYRLTWSDLMREKYLFANHAGPYAHAGDRRALLAERIEVLAAQEHQQWLTDLRVGQREVAPAPARNTPQ